MSKDEYLIVPKGTKFTGSGKLGLKHCSRLLMVQDHMILEHMVKEHVVLDYKSKLVEAEIS